MYIYTNFVYDFKIGMCTGYVHTKARTDAKSLPDQNVNKY